MASQAYDERMANHVAGSTALQGNTHWVVGVERVNVGGLVRLHTENCWFWATINPTVVVIEPAITTVRR